MGKQGFASLSKKRHLELSSKGGKARVPKGFSALSPRQRKINGRNASRERWRKQKSSGKKVERLQELPTKRWWIPHLLKRRKG